MDTSIKKHRMLCTNVVFFLIFYIIFSEKKKQDTHSIPYLVQYSKISLQNTNPDFTKPRK